MQLRGVIYTAVFKKFSIPIRVKDSHKLVMKSA